MRHDDVWCEALRFEFEAFSEHRFGADDFGFEVERPRVHTLCGAFGGLIRMHPHASPIGGGFFFHHQGMHLMAFFDHGRCQVQELPWKVLVNEKNFHRVKI